VGTDDLYVNSVDRLFGSDHFTVLPNPSAPLIISPNSEVDFTVQYVPGSTPGDESAQIRIASNDPGAPYFDLMATATTGIPAMATIIADSGEFGDVCMGSFKDLDLTLNNSGGCDLRISNISSSSTQFQAPGTLSYPLAVAPGTSLPVPIRLAPTTTGPKSADITISSNDPAAPSKMVAVTGFTPPPDVRVTGSTEFGDVCAGVQSEKTLSVCDVGPCDLHVTSVAFEPACPDFTLVNNPFPATVSPDSCESVVIRFTPTSVGMKTCTLVIRTDDPDQPVISKTVKGNTPIPSIDVPPDMGFAPTVIQSVGACTTGNPFPVSNTGTCPLVITNYAVTTDAAEYSLSGLPSFPIRLDPGHVAGEGDLDVVFAPQALDRDLQGAVTVTYESDTVTHATTNVVRDVCGEGVRTGARVLVTAGGVPMAQVEQIKLSRINANRNKNLLDTVDNARNLDLQTVTPAAPCGAYQYHREYGTVSNPIQLLPGSYNITVTAVINGHRQKKTVGFDLSTCGFNPTIVVNF
jgi:HYDIN/CFA65/VesB-like, Ig-like domain